MEWIAEYGRFLLAIILIIVGLIGIRWAKSAANDQDDPEMARNARGFGALGWGALLIGIFLLIVYVFRVLF